MAAIPEHFATHEAAHAVMQWFVGYEAELELIQMRRVPEGATNAAMKAKPPIIHTLSSARSRLLVLFAGSCTTNLRFNCDKQDFNKDWMDIMGVTKVYLKKSNIKWICSDGYSLRDYEANSLLLDVENKANEIVGFQPIAHAITSVADLLLNAPPDFDGFCIVKGAEITSTCLAECGNELRQINKWSGWLKAD